MEDGKHVHVIYAASIEQRKHAPVLHAVCMEGLVRLLSVIRCANRAVSMYYAMLCYVMLYYIVLYDAVLSADHNVRSCWSVPKTRGNMQGRRLQY